MNFSLILFSLFAFVLVSSAIVAVCVRNMVYSVMFLILAFVNAAALFILTGSEYVAMLLIVVYVGAIAVLFLFVVMMLNVDSKKDPNEFDRNKPLLLMIGIIILCEIILMIKFSNVGYFETKILYGYEKGAPNVKSIGKILYTDFVLPFQMAGIILFVAMIGAIVLTLRDEKRLIKKQIIAKQVSRNKANSIEIIKTNPNQNLNI